MLKFDEIASGVWVFPSSGTGENCGVVLGEGGALLVDPTPHPTDLDAIERFLTEMVRDVRALIFTETPVEEISSWPGVPYITPGKTENGVSLPDLIEGWLAVSLESSNTGRLAVYQLQDKTLFCGDMLSDVSIGIPALDGASQSYLDSLTRIEELDPKLVIPRRGGSAAGKRAIRTRIESDRNYIYSIHRHIITSMSSGVSLERVLAVASQVYEDFPFLKEHLKNIRYVWEEMAEA